MRRFASILISVVLGLVLMLRAVLPALPVYVCTAMGGEHLLAPCCPSDDSHSDDGPVVYSRCCIPEDQPAIDIQRSQPIQVSALLATPALLTAAQVLTLPLPVLMLRPLTARNGPPPIGPPPSRHKVLRI
ncbi:MAG: hypothetical protein JNJ46_18455 [Myxococcales bacterium]|nr:hypothetical protein [Myxococcales bacterium]